MGWIKKLELNICGGIDTPKPGFRDCQTKMKMFPFYISWAKKTTGHKTNSSGDILYNWIPDTYFATT